MSVKKETIEEQLNTYHKLNTKPITNLIKPEQVLTREESEKLYNSIQNTIVEMNNTNNKEELNLQVEMYLRKFDNFINLIHEVNNPKIKDNLIVLFILKEYFNYTEEFENIILMKILPDMFR